jgi:hypothetical protein
MQNAELKIGVRPQSRSVLPGGFEACDEDRNQLIAFGA